MKPAPRIAIIGSGPSGCFCAQFLQRTFTDASIVVIDQLPTPFGLIRYGVAPDHVGTKQISQQFERLFEQGGVHFLGNVSVGRDVSLEAVRALFDVVVIATGLHADKALDIPGAALPEAYGAGQITRYFNDHPEAATFVPQFGQRVAVIGNGNVAMDIVRLLAKGANEFMGSEVSPRVWAQLQDSGVTDIHVVGRSAIDQAKFDVVLLKELQKIEGVRFVWANHNALPAQAVASMGAKGLALAALVQQSPQGASTKTVTFYFGFVPQAIEGEARVTGLTLANDEGRTVSLAVDSIISAIGFTQCPHHPLQQCAVGKTPEAHVEGWLDQGLYCVGWFKRGPRGTIADNRKEVKEMVALMAEQLISHPPQGHKEGWQGLQRLLTQQQVAYTDFAHWQRLNAFEQSRAHADRCREKVNDLVEMMRVRT